MSLSVKVLSPRTGRTLACLDLRGCVFSFRYAKTDVGRGQAADVSATRQKTNVESIDALKDLIQLRVLILDRIKVANIGALKGLLRLQVLVLHSTNVENIDALKDLDELETLYLGHTGIRHIKALKGLTTLRTLEPSHTPIQDVEVLKGLKTLVLNDTNAWDADELKAALPNIVARFLT
ncbi:hypothetical protein [Paraburkholderia aspalathi]|uniref:hypothetical protein n=1 Tax=Paraburkholderia aspalathi TaxID=1324617 RepID=UPI001B1C8C2B|nr:hypothetical protein [Paraburkholderia aspalathi]CAE6755900.1 hypothetical protein R20943_03141 [Paraburkholderia aspalathi]